MRFHHLLLVAGLFCSQKIQAQTGSFLTLYAVYPGSGQFHGRVLIGGGTDRHITDPLVAGADYGYGFSRHCSIHAGMEWSQFHASATFYSDDPGSPSPVGTQSLGCVNLVSFPVSVRVVFLTYAFVQGGFLWDIQLHNTAYTLYSAKDGPLTPQNGLGALLNLGATFPLNRRLSISAALFNEYHGLTLSNPNNIDQKIYNNGLRLAISTIL